MSLCTYNLDELKYRDFMDNGINIYSDNYDYGGHITYICSYTHICMFNVNLHICTYVIMLIRTCNKWYVASNFVLLITVSDHTEVISLYYLYLLQHMDADSVSHMMHRNHLITDDDYEAIITAPSDRRMNNAILQYVRVMDFPTLLKFINLLQTIETQTSIASYLKLCKHVYRVYV